MLQPEVARQIHASGGIRAIAISHPHFFGGIATWAEEFDAPVYIHEKDKHFVTEPNSHIQPWSGVCALGRDSSDASQSYACSSGAVLAAASKQHSGARHVLSCLLSHTLDDSEPLWQQRCMLMWWSAQKVEGTQQHCWGAMSDRGIQDSWLGIAG